MSSILRLLALVTLTWFFLACGQGHPHDGKTDQGHDGVSTDHSHAGEADHDGSADPEHPHDDTAPGAPHDDTADHDHDTAGHSHDDASHAHDAEHHHADGEASPLIVGLRMNGEQRWMMDDHTREHLARMRTSCQEADSTTAEGLTAAAVTLDRLLDQLIAGCTMTGEPHNQLHALLAQLIPAVQELAETEDLESGQATLSRIETTLAEADRFFE